MVSIGIAYMVDLAHTAPRVGTQSRIPTKNMIIVRTDKPAPNSARLPNFCIRYHESRTLTQPRAMKPIPMAV